MNSTGLISLGPLIGNFFCFVFPLNTCYSTTWSMVGWICRCVCVCVCVQSLQLCLTLCDPMDCSPPGSSVHGILQARILGLPFPSPGDLPNPGMEPVSPALAGGFLLLSHQGSQNMQVWKLKYRTVKLWMDFHYAGSKRP